METIGRLSPSGEPYLRVLTATVPEDYPLGTRRVWRAVARVLRAASSPLATYPVTIAILRMRTREMIATTPLALDSVSHRTILYIPWGLRQWRHHRCLASRALRAPACPGARLRLSRVSTHPPLQRSRPCLAHARPARYN